MRGLYGSKAEIKKYINRHPGDRINEIMKPLNTSVVMDMPYAICDVTIPLRFSLESNGLVLEKMKTKENIMGFFNPIPPFKLEYDYPVLCIIYKKPSEGDVVHIDYFNDDEEVKILIDE